MGVRKEKYGADCRRAEGGAKRSDIRVVFSTAEVKRKKPGWIKEEALIVSGNIRLRRDEAEV